MDDIEFIALIAIFVQIGEYLISWNDVDDKLLLSVLNYESHFYIDAQIVVCNVAFHDYWLTLK